MALNPHFSTIARNAALDAAMNLMNSGTAKIYSGTQPANANTALSGNTLLATLTFASPAFASASAGSKTANAIASDTNAAATGTASFFRMFESDGTTVVGDGSVGTSSADMIITTTSIVAGETVSCSSCVISMPA